MRSALPIMAGLLLAAGPPARDVLAQSPVGQSELLWRATWLGAAPSADSGGNGVWRWQGPAAPIRQQRGVELARTTSMSALLPGLGQHRLGQDRKWAYLAVEAVGWILYTDRRGAAHDLRDQYRAFAWDEARVQAGPRTDGDFAYYETLTKWMRSGAFDTDPVAVGVQPEMDVSAFNGSIWSLAVQIYLPGGVGVPVSDPQYQRALAYYSDRAYGTAFLWDWTGTGTAQEQFGTLITESDDRFRQATNVLGIIIANHVVSAVDAFLSARGVSTLADAGVAPSPGPRGVGWSAWVALPTPR